MRWVKSLLGVINMSENTHLNHTSDEGYPRTDERKGPDIIVKTINLLSIGLWIFIIFNLCIILLSRPVGETFFDRLLNISVRNYWDANLLTFALVLSLIQFVISIFSFVLNTKRLKRKGDRIRISIIISIFFSLILCVCLVFVLL